MDEHLTVPTNGPESLATRRVSTVQEALHKFAQMLSSKWVFDEASVALDAGRDYKLTIYCTENAKGFVVALHRHESERLGENSYLKLTHGEWQS